MPPLPPQNRAVAVLREIYGDPESELELAEVLERQLAERPQTPEQESPALAATNVMDAFFETKAGGPNYSSDWNRASSAGDLCDRRLVYARTINEQAEPHGAWVQQIFEDGNAQEVLWKRRLMEAGFDIEQGQQSLQWPEYRLRGHIDGVLVYPTGEKVTLEVKRLDANAWQRIEKWQDFVKNDFYRHYPAQLGLYLRMKGQGRGVFLITSQGHFRFLDFDLEHDPEAAAYVDEALAQLVRVNAHVDAGTVPDRLLDMRPCARCKFAGVCLPETLWEDLEAQSAQGERIENAALEKALEDRAATHEASKAFNKADKAVKSAVRGRIKVWCGRWELNGKKSTMRRVDTAAMPEAMKIPYLTESDSWRYTIREVEEPMAALPNEDAPETT